MAAPSPDPQALRVSELSARAETPFALHLNVEVLRQIAADLDLTALRKVRFDGTVSPTGAGDWQLKARLGATVVQDCVVTLEPVTTRIDTEVRRLFVADYAEPEAVETEVPEDDTVEALGDWIDLVQVLREALSIAAPDYPRKDAAALGQMVYTEPGSVPMTDEAAKPFAGLADLKRKLQPPED